MDPKDITETTCAYTAGLMERASYLIKKDSSNYALVIKLSLHSDTLSEFLMYFWDAKPNTIKAENRHGKILSFHGKNALELAKRILPYVIEKRNECLIFEAFGKIRGDKFDKQQRFSEQQRQAFEILYQALSKFKKFMNTEKVNNLKKMHEKNKRYDFKEIYHDNIFDLFDGSLSMNDSKMAKSIFDDFLK